MIINGGMTVSQRATSVEPITSTSTYRTVDRYRQFINGLGTWTLEQHASGPTGFKNSYRVTCTVANASPAAGAYMFIRYGVEKQDLQRLAWGTADAKECTLSFWVKSNRTGTASLALMYTQTNTSGMTKTYTINTANTWEYKTITFPANTVSESNAADTGTGVWVEWWLNGGSTYSGGTANTTFGAIADNSRNPTNYGLGTNVNDEFYITGIQLEVGSKATPFEHESYGQTLAKCQRYCYKINVDAGFHFVNCMAYNASLVFGSIDFPVQMRSRPTIMTPSGAAGDYRITSFSAQVACTSLPSLNGSSIQSGQILFTSTGNVSTGYATMGTAGGNITIIFDGGSEL
tara:strand:+ start:1 stop:1038 length:1038 start_codon:yes stop_codon:yes gene_type:complete